MASPLAMLLAAEDCLCFSLDMPEVTGKEALPCCYYNTRRERKQMKYEHKCCISPSQTCSLLDISILGIYDQSLLLRAHMLKVHDVKYVHMQVSHVKVFLLFLSQRFYVIRGKPARYSWWLSLKIHSQNTEHRLVIMQIHREADNFTQKSRRPLKLSIICLHSSIQLLFSYNYTNS